MASSSRFPLPSYTPAFSKDVISLVPSLSALHPDPSHPAHQALLASPNLAKDSVKTYSFASGGIIVCPDELGNVAEQAEESWAKVGGYLQVISTTDKHVTQLRIKLVGRQSIAFPQDERYRERDDCFVKEVVLRNVQLRKGLTAFEFLLAIPHDTPVTQLSYGKPKEIATIRFFIVATVVDGTRGWFGGEKGLESEEEVWVEAAPMASSEFDCLKFNLHSQSLTKELGPTSLDASSSRFIVGGALFLSLTLHSPPPTLHIYALKLYLHQTSHLTSFRTPLSKTARVLTKVMLLEEGWPGPYRLEEMTQLLKEGRAEKERLFDAEKKEGSGWTFEKIGRIPSDLIRPTTHQNTKTNMRISTELVLDVIFTVDDPAVPRNTVLVATVLRKPVFLAGSA